jgi:hypothetical protein
MSMTTRYKIDNAFASAVKRVLAATSLMVCLASGSSFAQTPDKQTLESCSTPNSVRITTYKWLALSVYVHFNNGATEKATKMASALETVYDYSQYCLEERGVSEHETEKIDKLMDAFIKPIQGSATKAPDPASVAAAYHALVAEIDTLKSDEDPRK